MDGGKRDGHENWELNGHNFIRKHDCTSKRPLRAMCRKRICLERMLTRGLASAPYLLTPDQLSHAWTAPHPGQRWLARGGRALMAFGRPGAGRKFP